jgi:hypothetical protein
METSLGARHCDAGTNPVRHGGGWLIDRPKCSRPSPSKMVAAWAIVAPWGRISLISS